MEEYRSVPPNASLYGGHEITGAVVAQSRTPLSAFDLPATPMKTFGRGSSLYASITCNSLAGTLWAEAIRRSASMPKASRASAIFLHRSISEAEPIRIGQTGFNPSLEAAFIVTSDLEVRLTPTPKFGFTAWQPRAGAPFFPEAIPVPVTKPNMLFLAISRPTNLPTPVLSFSKRNKTKGLSPPPLPHPSPTNPPLPFVSTMP
mmetsp:Transcript_15616/g.63726  ORF Transcript_15616/g.63726 Transcript_15616/m.63726 type:complete len:203 (+) Transcript_15616:4335-4943(+)